MLKFFGGVVTALVVVFGGAYLVANRGWFPVGADNAPGHLERRLAHMATDAYVARHAPEQENPIPLTPATLSEGARIYEEHCSVCHGGAVHKISPLQHRFSPPVPQLVNRVPRDPDGDFFWITKHGYRLTGMPSWDGILSDDQIWTVVAFIKHSDKLPPEAQAAWQEAADSTRS
ncbi:MAG: c-type cytochrome [Gemmatimonadetes bacterium]|nr:c-type cytochrome [Gemmatimonadota bacterium]